MEFLGDDSSKTAFAKYLNRMEGSGELSVEHAKLEIVSQILRCMSELDMSKAELARELDTSRAYVTQFLQGNVNFTVESLVKIGNALGRELECRFTPRNTMNWLEHESYLTVNCFQLNDDETSEENESYVTPEVRKYAALSS